jgi:MFS family permease
VLPSQTRAAGIGSSALGIILSANRMVRLAANAAAGMVYDRVGCRQPYLLAMALAVVSTFGYAVAWGFWPLFGARVIWGVAFSLITVGAFSMLVDTTTEADRGRTIGRYQSIVQFGTLLAFLVSGLSTDLIGYRRTLVIFTALTGLGWVVAFWTLEETRRDRPSWLAALRHRRSAQSRSGQRPVEVSTSRQGRLLSLPFLLACHAHFVISFAGNGVLMSTLGFFVQEELELGVASATGALLALRRLVFMVGAPLSGRLSDRLGDRQLVAMSGTLASLTGFVVLAAGRGVPAIAGGVVLVALGEAILLPSLAALAGDLAPPQRRGALLAGFATAADLGGAAGPLVGYTLATTLGLRWAYLLCALLMLSALGALSMSRRRVSRGSTG